MSSSVETSPATPEHGPVLRRPVFGLLVLALVGFVPGFLAIDAWVGWYDARGQKDGGSEYYLRDEQLGWVPRPGFANPEFETELDSRGMRNAEVPANAPADEVRIAGFGASRVYGAAGAMQSLIWSSRLQGDESLANARFLNAGVMGYSTVQACRRAIRILPELEADLVFVLVSPGPQSMLDPSSARNWVRMGGKEGGELVRADVVEGWPAFMHPFLVRLHEMLMHSSLYTRNRSKIALGNDDRDASVQRWLLSRTAPGAAVEGMLERTFAELSALQQLADELGVELRVMAFPEQAQADADFWDTFCRNNAKRGAPPAGTPRSEPTEVLIERCAELGIECWDFSGEVDRLGADGDRYLAEDGRHWSDEGHGVVAEGIARRLKAGLLDELARTRAANPRSPETGGAE